jgi:hypothetical protein
MALIRLNNQSLTGVTGLPLQVRQTQLTTDSTLSLSAATDTVVTGFTVNITPTSTSSIIKCEAMFMGEFGDDDPNSYNHLFFFYRDTTKLGYTGTAGNRNFGVAPATRTIDIENQGTSIETAYLSFFDSPSSTSQITYKLGVSAELADTLYINKTVNAADNFNQERGTSFISVTEIAG